MTTRTSHLMRFTLAVAVLSCTALVLSRGFARADGGGHGGGGGMPSSPSSTFEPPAQQSPEEKAAADQKHAQELYDQAYREVDKAKAELAESATLQAQLKAAPGGIDAGLARKAEEKADSARKRLEKSRDKFDEVTTLDPKNADGWNMLGYTRRKTGDSKNAFDAYWKCLALKPEHVGAHEYLGEAYLEQGKITEAKAELAWLQKKGDEAKEQVAHLDAAITAWVAANPTAAAAATDSTAAAATAH